MRSKVRIKLLEYLSRTDDYISGESLSQELGVSRTAIWKNIAKLKEEGYGIESMTNRGYRLVSSPEGLSSSALLKEIKLDGFEDVFLSQSVDSTNLEAKRKVDLCNGNACFIAYEQTKGRGRRGRKWESPLGSGLYMSLLVRPKIISAKAPMLTLLTGLELCCVLREMTGLDIGIKWPNDIVIKGKKVAGILTEMSGEIEGLDYVIIGIGLNIAQEKFAQEIAEKATSLKRESTGNTVFAFDQYTYITSLVHRLSKSLKEFEKVQNLSFISKAYEDLCVNISKDVRIESPKESYVGKGKGINHQGELLIEMEDGSIKTIRSGEVSVRGLYGYV